VTDSFIKEYLFITDILVGEPVS